MAALGDLSGTGRTLIHEISDALKQEKLLDPDEEFETVDHILSGLEKTSARLAGAVNTPPLDVAALRQEWNEIREDVKAIPPPNRPSSQRLWNQWKDLRSVAAQQGLSVFQLSSVMAMSAMEKVPDRLRWLSRSAPLAARRGAAGSFRLSTLFGDGNVGDGEGAGSPPLALAQRSVGCPPDGRGLRGAVAGSLQPDLV
jgi:hypothetical protein